MYLLAAVLLVGWLALAFVAIWAAVEFERFVWVGILGGVLWLVLTLAGIFALVDSTTKQGPCLRYETSYQMVGKVMTPYRYCVERGEWTQP